MLIFVSFKEEANGANRFVCHFDIVFTKDSCDFLGGAFGVGEYDQVNIKKVRQEIWHTGHQFSPY